MGGVGHVVFEVVEAEFVVGAVGYVALVLLAACGGVLLGEDDAGGEAEGFVDASHLFCLGFGEVVVDGDDVDALASEGVEVGGGYGCEGFAGSGG